MRELQEDGKSYEYSVQRACLANESAQLAGSATEHWSSCSTQERGSVQRLATIVALTRHSMKPWGSLGRRATCHGSGGYREQQKEETTGHGRQHVREGAKARGHSGSIGSVWSRTDCTAFTCLRSACCAYRTPYKHHASRHFVQIHHTEAQCVSHSPSPIQPARTGTHI